MAKRVRAYIQRSPSLYLSKQKSPATLSGQRGFPLLGSRVQIARCRYVRISHSFPPASPSGYFSFTIGSGSPSGM